jgi:hypothetical protein
MEYAYMQGRVIAHPICNLHASHRRFFLLLPTPSVVISPTTTPNYTAHSYSSTNHPRSMGKSVFLPHLNNQPEPSLLHCFIQSTNPPRPHLQNQSFLLIFYLRVTILNNRTQTLHPSHPTPGKKQTNTVVPSTAQNQPTTHYTTEKTKRSCKTNT